MATRKKPIPRKSEWPEGVVFTVGHSVLALDTFVALLHAYGIQSLADIRTVPRSRHNPQFNADVLSRALPREGIEYVPLPALGGLRRPRKDSANTGWRNEGFRGFADYMQTPKFKDGLKLLIDMSGKKRTVIMCAEAVPWRCHRSLVADALAVRSVPVVEILSEIPGSQAHAFCARARDDDHLSARAREFALAKQARPTGKARGISWLP